MKVSEICGKIIESNEGKRGYVISVNETGGTPCCLVCADENEREFTVDIADITVTRGIITYRDRQSEIAKSKPIRLGRSVYDDDGKFMGVLSDFVFEPEKKSYMCVGKRKFPAEDAKSGDIIIIQKPPRTLKDDVKKDGRVIFKKGTPLTGEVLNAARLEGEYIQTNLKSI